jgi:hypothetical protein
MITSTMMSAGIDIIDYMNTGKWRFLYMHRHLPLFVEKQLEELISNCLKGEARDS